VTHLDIAGEMDDDLRPVTNEHFLDEAAVADISPFERPPADRPVVSLLQGVQADRLGTSLRQRFADMTADVTGAAGDEHRTTD
jgi:hypothetical protein